jgi:hypothetical protein
MDVASHVKFANAYNEAAAGTFFGQTPEKQDLYLNEAFADFITGQVVGGVRYFEPAGGLLSPHQGSFCPQSSLVCLEDNVGGMSVYPYQQGSPSFDDEVARVMTTVHDAFDGHFAFDFPGASSVPSNGNVWKLNMSRIEFSGRGDHAKDDEVRAPGRVIPEIVRGLFSLGFA